MSVSYLDNI